METKKIKYIDWDKTAINLKLLRRDDIVLRRNVCRILRYDDANCSGICGECKFDMDHSISQAELAKVFKVPENRIVNWENGKSKPQLEYILYYCDLSEKGIDEVIVFAR